MRPLTLVIPAYNEERRIARTLDRYLSLPVLSQLIVVCDGGDRTAEIAKKKFGGRADVLEYGKRLGKGGALIEGFRRARCEYVGFVDADGAVSTRDFLSALDALASDPEIGMVICTRKKRGFFSLRHVASGGFVMLANLLFGLGVDDSQCGAKIMRRKALMEIMPMLSAKDWVFDVDLIFNMKKRWKVAEAQVDYEYSPDGKLNPLTSGQGMLVSLFHLRMRSLHCFQKSRRRPRPGKN